MGRPPPLRADLSSGWARVSSGMLEHEGGAILLVSTAALVGRAAPAAA